MTHALNRPGVRRLKKGCFGIGLAALVACALGGGADVKQFFAAYLFGHLFWLGLTLGCLSVLMIHHLTSGRWGFVIRRFLEAGVGVLPWMALFFVPIFFGLEQLYPWAHPGGDAEIIGSKGVYLNEPGFIGRAVFFLVLWMGLGSLLRRWSFAQDGVSTVAPTRWLRGLSGPGLILFPITATFAYVDWVMSLEPEWYSTIFVIIILVGQILTAFAFAAIALYFTFEKEPFAGIVRTVDFHHLGNLMLTFVLFWTYVSFSQFLIIWNGNTVHEISWYLHRTAGGWKWVIGIIAVFHFALPFILLLFRETKKRPRVLGMIAGAVLAAHVISVYWLIQPAFDTRGFHFSWMSLLAWIGFGGIWCGLFLMRIGRWPLLPVGDPRFKEGGL